MSAMTDDTHLYRVYGCILKGIDNSFQAHSFKNVKTNEKFLKNLVFDVNLEIQIVKENLNMMHKTFQLLHQHFNLGTPQPLPESISISK